MAHTRFDPITLEILWTRLVSIVDEAAANYVRTAFSTLVQESNDFAVVLTDAQGRSLAQSTKSIPSFIGTLPRTVGHFLDRFPANTLKPGDVLITNDPWLGTGHLPDISIAMPLFHKRKLVAFAAVTSHMPDIGGRTWNAGIRELFEEGLQIPPLKLIEAGRINETAVAFIRQNVRVPELTMGDVWAEVACCHCIGEGLINLIEEAGVEVAALAKEVQRRSENAMRAAIEAIPDGVYRSRVENDVGLEESLVAECRMTVKGSNMAIDYTGSTRQLPRAINSVPAYTFAYTCFGVKAVLSPDLPNNDGSYRPITTWAPEGTIFNPRYPAACTTRGMAGQLLPPAVMLALAEAIPDRIQGCPGSPQCSMMLSGEHRGRGYALINFASGSMGGGPRRDGVSTVSFPSNVANVPMEVSESLLPIRVLRRERREGSGGAGKYRGGDGQRVEFEFLGETPGVASILMNRLNHPAAGVLGGKEGATGCAYLNGKPRLPSEHWVLNKGDRVMLETPGGGGYGAP
ncbi:MAG: hydantoinase B/oxoprolinase family protein [Acetobacterales bacterium]